MFIDRYLEEGIKLDYWWMDAGWYNHHGGGWPHVGTWEVDTKRFPHGLRAVSRLRPQPRASRPSSGSSRNASRRTPGSTRNHPEWLLGERQGGLLNLGNAEARALADRPHGPAPDRAGHRPLPAGFQHGPARRSGAATTRPTARASPRSSTSPATSPTGTNCGAGTRTC